MNIKGVAGSIGGVSAKGGYIDLDSADAASIINATAGFIKTGIGIGLKVGVAVGILSLLFRGLKVTYSPSIPITSFCKIKTYSKEVSGVCFAESTKWLCDGQVIEIPTYLINNVSAMFNPGLFTEKMFTKDFLDAYYVNCIDGSHYVCKPMSQDLIFVTMCGVQKVTLYAQGTVEKKTFFGTKRVPTWFPEEPGLTDVYAKISGASVRDVDMLRKQLNFALENNLDSVINTVGQSVFEKYFQIS